MCISSFIPPFNLSHDVSIPQQRRPMSFLVQPWLQHSPAKPKEKLRFFLSGLSQLMSIFLKRPDGNSSSSQVLSPTSPSASSDGSGSTCPLSVGSRMTCSSSLRDEGCFWLGLQTSSAFLSEGLWKEVSKKGSERIEDKDDSK